MIFKSLNDYPALKNALEWWCPIYNSINCICAGGFLRSFFSGELMNDMDLFFEDIDKYTYASHIFDLSDEYSLVSETENAKTYLSRRKKSVQLIKYRFGNMQDILSMFDFTVCSCAVKGDDICMDDFFFEHLASKLLVFKDTKMPLSTLKRVVKYVKRGYSICDENLIKISQKISEVNFSDELVLNEQIGGMDPDGARRIRMID